MLRPYLPVIFAVLAWHHGIAQTTAAADTTQEEKRWEELAADVDSFAYSAAFVDSVRSVHNVPVPSPLRELAREPFSVPETLVYKIGWGPFNAGYVVITTLYDPATGTVRIGGKALSNAVVGAFYRMRDYVISTVDQRGLYPLFFEQHLREGKRYKANEFFIFDHAAGKVLVQKRDKSEIKETPPYTQDYMSMLYLIRSHHALAPGDTFSERLFINAKFHSMFFSVKSSNSREVEAGSFPCVLLVPQLVGDGRAFNKKDKLEIWMSDDPRRLPVAIKSKIKFGSIYARLIWYNANQCSAGVPKG